MDPTQMLQLFLLRVLGFGALAGYLLSVLQPSFVPQAIRSRPYAYAIGASILLQLIYSRVIYPTFVSPLRHLPTIKGVSIIIHNLVRSMPTTNTQQQSDRGQILYESPRGKSALKWMQQLPDAELIAITGQAGLAPVVVAGPEALRDILTTRADDFVKPWGVRAFLARAIGWGLILAEGHEHKKQKRALTPAFNIRRIRELYGLMWAKTQILLAEVAKDVQKQAGDDGFGVIELSEWSSRLTLDIIGPTAVGRDFHSLTAESNPIADAFLELLRPEVSRLVFFFLHFVIPEWLIRRLPLKENGVLNEIGGYLRGVCSDIIREKKSGLEKKGELAEHDMLSRIIQTGEFTDSEVMNQMLTFLAAGVSLVDLLTISLLSIPSI